MHLSDVLPIAKQIADALEAAHEQGIIHRDLKPANIKVRADGTVKVLDFGLAKAMDPSNGSNVEAMNSPTMTARATQMGMIIGTAAYMSPEQARGRTVDRRADIWAFGVVLYEMLTGRRTFEGEDISVTLANVIKETPKFDALPPDLPAPIRRLLRRCLEKDPKRRLSSIGDARLELDEASSPADVTDVTTVAAPRSGVARWERVIWATLASVATVAAVAFGLRATANREATPAMVRFGVFPPGEGRFVGAAPRFAISPDGKALVFSATPQPNKPEQLWIRLLDSMHLKPVPGSESAASAAAPQSPFWSPDGRRLAFVVESTLKAGTVGSRLQAVDLASGAMQTVCELPLNNASGTWNTGGTMLVSSQGSKGIQRVGGALTPVTTLDPATNEVAHLWPQFLPDGRHFIYQSQTEVRSGWSIFIGSIDSADRQKVVQSDYARFAAPNLLLYTKNENLLAQTMDLETYQLSGDPVVVGSGIPFLPSNGRAAFSVSDAGVLVYSIRPDQQAGGADRRLTWYDRSGKPLDPVGPPTSAFAFRLSPDNLGVALLELMPDRATGRQVWVADLGRSVKAPLTSTRPAYSPVWSYDGARVLFGSEDGTPNLMIAERLASGATPMATIYRKAGQDAVPLDESSDGARVVFSLNDGGRRGLYVLSRSDAKVVPYMVDGFDHPHASLSRDGRWMAYTSNESGVYEVVVQSFPDPSRGKWPISSNGGLFPRWRRDGRELFYVNADQQIMAAPVTVNPTFVPGTAVPLFALPVTPGTAATGAYLYDVSLDGRRILMSLPPGGFQIGSAAVPLTVTTNWTQLLKVAK